MIKCENSLMGKYIKCDNICYIVIVWREKRYPYIQFVFLQKLEIFQQIYELIDNILISNIIQLKLLYNNSYLFSLFFGTLIINKSFQSVQANTFTMSQCVIQWKPWPNA